MIAGFAAAASTLANVVVIGGFFYAILRPKHDERAKAIVAVAIPIIFNLAVLCFKSTLASGERVGGLVATLAFGLLYAALVGSGKLPPASSPVQANVR